MGSLEGIHDVAKELQCLIEQEKGCYHTKQKCFHWLQVMEVLGLTIQITAISGSGAAWCVHHLGECLQTPNKRRVFCVRDASKVTIMLCPPRNELYLVHLARPSRTGYGAKGHDAPTS